jgi:hypothetical protein
MVLRQYLSSACLLSHHIDYQSIRSTGIGRNEATERYSETFAYRHNQQHREGSNAGVSVPFDH